MRGRIGGVFNKWHLKKITGLSRLLPLYIYRTDSTALRLVSNNASTNCTEELFDSHGS